MSAPTGLEEKRKKREKPANKVDLVDFIVTDDDGDNDDPGKTKIKKDKKAEKKEKGRDREKDKAARGPIKCPFEKTIVAKVTSSDHDSTWNMVAAKQMRAQMTTEAAEHVAGVAVEMRENAALVRAAMAANKIEKLIDSAFSNLSAAINMLIKGGQQVNYNKAITLASPSTRPHSTIDRHHGCAAMDGTFKQSIALHELLANKLEKQSDRAFHSLSSALNHLMQVEAATLVAEHQSLITSVGTAGLLQLHIDEIMDKASSLHLGYEAARTKDSPTNRASVRRWVVDQAAPGVFVEQRGGSQELLSKETRASIKRFLRIGEVLLWLSNAFSAGVLILLSGTEWRKEYVVIQNRSWYNDLRVPDDLLGITRKSP
ncbi:hypothetical protein KCU65_g6512, partial [Aureobasidium melanogenum]